MTTTVTRRYSFEAAHFLPKVAEGHKCKRMHGHNYVMDVTIDGPVLDSGFLLDFWDMDKIVDPIIAIVDHRVLNDIAGLENPTAENIAEWFFKAIRAGMILENRHHVSQIRIFETSNCWADYRP